MRPDHITLLLLFHILPSNAYPKSSCFCERKFRPVCGSDGVTYDSECHLQCARSQKEDLRLLYTGTCCPRSSCPPLVAPVCDNFGRTHSNECNFHFHKCLRKKLQHKKLYIMHLGECRPEEKRKEDCSKLLCDEIDDGPLCDANGTTHSSTCLFEKLNCIRRTENEPEIEVAHKGSCQELNTSLPTAKRPILTSAKALKDLANRTQNLVPHNFSEKEIRAAKALASDERGEIIAIVASTVASESIVSTTTTTASSLYVDGEAAANTKVQRDWITPTTPTSQEPIASSSSEEVSKLSEKFDISSETIARIWIAADRCSAVGCTKHWKPICDSQGRTHKNFCLFNFFACKVYRSQGIILELEHQGECRPNWKYPAKDEGCGICSLAKEQTQVCDNKNQTHPSLCHLSAWNCQMKKRKHTDTRVLVHIGPCKENNQIFDEAEEICPRQCPEDDKPVCDENMVEHKNLCNFQMKNCIERKLGRSTAHLSRLSECPRPNEIIASHVKNCPPPKCSNTIEPVCDSQGNVHLNKCIYEAAKCHAALRGITLHVVDAEKCQQCALDCADYPTGQICASDFVTYDNYCLFKRAKCMNESLTTLFKGACSLCFREPCPEHETKEAELVCDQNGMTRSRCEFNMLHCVLRQNFGYNLSVIHEGHCCPTAQSCTNVVDREICASDKKTYRNLCLFNVEKCRQQKLKGVKLQMRPCEDKLTFLKQRDEKDMSRNESGSCDLLECGNEYAPICGTNDVTYTNACELKTQQCNSNSSLGIAYLGECCPKTCPSNWDPVCDSDSKNHQNLCAFGFIRCLEERKFNRKVTISKFGLCEETVSCKECEKTYEPICGNNEETFVNTCHLEKYNCLIRKGMQSGEPVRKAYDGECCSSGQQCEISFEPVCDSKGETHSNMCAFKKTQCKLQKLQNESITIAYKGQCCSQPCEESYSPVCDGAVTHKNMCKFKNAQCEAERNGKIILLAYSGECCEFLNDDCVLSGHICDSDGQTHANMCHFKRKRCILERSKLKSVSVAHTGECCQIESCSDVVEPVCDSFGATHASFCHFKNTKCIHDKLHPNNTLHFSYNGACCTSTCPSEWDPVCDQHGRTYKNNCFFQLKACELRRQASSMLLETPCPERRVRSLHSKTTSLPVGGHILRAIRRL